MSRLKHVYAEITARMFILCISQIHTVAFSQKHVHKFPTSLFSNSFANPSVSVMLKCMYIFLRVAALRFVVFFKGGCFTFLKLCTPTY